MAFSFADQVATWGKSITQPFGQSGETGVDIGLPYHTPVYSLTPGIVRGAGYYAGGGVVSVGSAINYSGIHGPASIYYQHLSDEVVNVGQSVKRGQLLGFSGGQVGYGDHPSTSQFSTGPHIEVGINAPYGGIWAPLGRNVDPTAFVASGGSGTGSGPASDYASCAAACNGDIACMAQCAVQYAGTLLAPGGLGASAGETTQNALQNDPFGIGSAFAGLEAKSADLAKRVGVFLGAVLLVAGGFWYLTHPNPEEAPDIITRISGAIGNLPVNVQASSNARPGLFGGAQAAAQPSSSAATGTTSGTAGVTRPLIPLPIRRGASAATGAPRKPPSAPAYAPGKAGPGIRSAGIAARNAAAGIGAGSDAARLARARAGRGHPLGTMRLGAGA